jgi:hypothetical protein
MNCTEYVQPLFMETKGLLTPIPIPLCPNGIP